MATKRKQKLSARAPRVFYRISLSEEKADNLFYPEYSILFKTVESVNSFYELYQVGRRRATGGPSTHKQQDLYRAMLIFACAGLDVFVKKLVTDKLSKLIPVDKEVERKFMEYVQKGLKDEKILNTLGLALISNTPRDVFLSEYIKSMTGDSLQSVEALCTVSNASGLETKKIFNKARIDILKEAFTVRNQIIHEMDINTESGTSRTTGYRTRRQRRSTEMEKHTKSVLELAEELLIAYKERFQNFKIGTEKPTISKAPSP